MPCPTDPRSFLEHLCCDLVLKIQRCALVEKALLQDPVTLRMLCNSKCFLANPEKRTQIVRGKLRKQLIDTHHNGLNNYHVASVPCMFNCIPSKPVYRCRNLLDGKEMPMQCTSERRTRSFHSTLFFLLSPTGRICRFRDGERTADACAPRPASPVENCKDTQTCCWGLLAHGRESFSTVNSEEPRTGRPAETQHMSALRTRATASGYSKFGPVPMTFRSTAAT